MNGIVVIDYDPAWPDVFERLRAYPAGVRILADADLSDEERTRIETANRRDPT